jgi:peptidoglycan/LPS O-acetylase OafA/YrhL
VFIAVASFVLRLRFPIDSYQIGSAHVWQWGQCIGLFALGVIAGRRGWLPSIPPSIRRTCAWLALSGLSAVVAFLIVLGDHADPAGGGWHWQSAVVAVLEGLISVTATIVLVDLFRPVHPGPTSNALIRSAYGAYLLQTPVLVGLALAVRPVPLPTTAKLLIVLPAAIAGSFGLALLVLRIRPVARVI